MKAEKEIDGLSFAYFTTIVKETYMAILLEFLSVRKVEFKDRLGILFQAKRNFDTACVQFPKMLNGPHIVTLGYGIYESYKKGGCRGTLQNYLRVYLIHELGHVLSLYQLLVAAGHTLESYSRHLAKKHIKFSMFNLFIDAHDEHFMRKLLGIHFNWLSYESYPKEPGTPESLFWSLIQNEGSYPVFNKKFSSKGEVVAARVRDHYYARTIAATSLTEIEDLMTEWLSEFSHPTESWGRGNTSGETAQEASGSGGDIEQSTQEGEPKNTSADGKSIVVNIGSFGLTEILSQLKDFKEITEEDENCFQGAPGLEVNGRGGSALENGIYRDLDQINTIKANGQVLARALEKILQVRYKPSVEQAGNKIDFIESILKSPTYFENESSLKDFLKTSLIVDCSGSMGEKYTDSSLTLAWALSCLARKKKLEGDVIFSKVVDRKVLSTKISLKRLNATHLGRVLSNGSAEGIFEAIIDHARSLNKVSKVYVFTDGAICDRILSKAERKKHIRPPVVGVYVGSRANVEAKNFFDSWLVDSTLIGASKQMIKEAKSLKLKSDN